MPGSKNDEPKPSYQLLSKITSYMDYKLCLRAHINCSDSDSDSSGASDFNEEYYKLRPPPIKISGLTPNLLYCNNQTADENNTITIDRKSGAEAKNDQMTITQSVSKANLNKKKRKKAKKKAKVTLEGTSELNSVLIESEQNANLEFELNARPGPSLSELKTSPENLNSVARLENSIHEMNGEHNFTTPFIEVKRRKPKKRTNCNTLRCTPQLRSKNLYIRACVSSPSVSVSKENKQQAALEERIKSQIRTSPLWFYFENCEMTLKEIELLRCHFIEQYLQEEQRNCAVKVGKKALKKARACLRRNLTLDFSSFFNTNLQGELSVETETEPQVPQEDCVVGKISSKKTTRKQHDANPQVDCKPPLPKVEQPDDLEWYNFVTEDLQELQSVNRPMKNRLIPGSSKMEPQVEQEDCVIKVGRKPSRKAMNCLRRNLSLDFSSFINLNLQGNQTVEWLLETWA